MVGIFLRPFRPYLGTKQVERMFWKANIFFTRNCLWKLIQWRSELIIHLRDGSFIIIFSLLGRKWQAFSQDHLDQFFTTWPFFSNGEHFLAWIKTSWLVVLADHYLLGHRIFIKNESMVKCVNPPPESWCTHNFFSLTRWEVSGICLRPFRLVLGAKQVDWLFFVGQYILDQRLFPKLRL